MTFEILLNPSVPVEDELRLSRQANKMYGLFRIRQRIGLCVSTIDLEEIGNQYQARLYEVRRALIPLGWCIDLVRKGQGGINYYKLVRVEDSKFYAERKYTL